MSQPPPRFAADCMLGRLAKWLRILGCDTLYFRHVADRDLLQLAEREGRLVLTRDRRLAAGAASHRVVLVGSDHLERQLAQVIEGCGLILLRQRFLTRCLVCNGELARLDRQTLRGRVPDYVFATQTLFSACPDCGKVYWNSSHVQQMVRRLERMKIVIR